MPGWRAVLDEGMAVPFPRPHRFDVAVAVGGLLGGVLTWRLELYWTLWSRLPGAWTLIPLAVTCAMAPLRRTRPGAAFAVGTLMAVATMFTDINFVTLAVYSDLTYAAARYGSPALAGRLPVGTGVATVLVTVGSGLWWGDVASGVAMGFLMVVVSFTPAVTGALVRGHRDAAETARLRAEQTALLAEVDRTQAVAAERTRMARELHDMVANHLSAIAIHSTAALSLDDPGISRDALGVVRENSVAGLAEMRRLIGILRDDAGDPEPVAAPTLDGLGALVESARANGLDVTLVAGYGRLPTPVGLAAYRIVQESLTNALKHAVPGPVTVVLAQRRGALTVTVTSPYGDREGPRAPGSGTGLVGMRERAALLGGGFEAGPEKGADSASGGGSGSASASGEGSGSTSSESSGEVWAVRVTLPLTEGEPT